MAIFFNLRVVRLNRIIVLLKLIYSTHNIISAESTIFWGPGELIATSDNERAAPNPLRPGVRGPLKGPEKEKN